MYCYAPPPQGFAAVPMQPARFAPVASVGDPVVGLAAHARQLHGASETSPPDAAREAGSAGRRRNRRGKRRGLGRAAAAAAGHCPDEAPWASGDLPPLSASEGQETRGLALSKHGCVVLQNAIEAAQAPDLRRLASELYPHAVELYESPHGNHVLSKLIQHLPPPAFQPLIDKLQEKGAPAIAKHQYGCRVLERLVEHCPPDQIASMLNELADDSEALSRDPYGNFVIQHILEHGSPDLRCLLFERLLPAAPRLATHRTASHVVQRVLDFCDEGSAVADSLLLSQSPHSLEEVACNRYGCHVVKQLSELRDAVRRAIVRERLSLHLPPLEASEFGRRALEAFELVTPLPEEAQARTADGP